ncbi:NitT/TauT family transport system ATP-binding protein [Arboricoccus pini]|uniref:NitT/TauT family transport system ATP-binding protein n=1 Tax=Arboricoccus pini TaxID=1963835 RepID=A0A212S2Z6_9PROT|nr:ABC transporter ATP-binding protein [Arboricoccus pini]SNB79544.1 NitT/TauT family transport system ATP-binding protein [Arboricoccus pini]
MTTIAFKSVSKEYGGVRVLEDISLELADHEFLGVVGPSGAGKSTFLRLLLSQEQPTHGKILIDGQPIAPEPSQDRGVVFQRYSVFPHLSVLRNVTLGREWAKAPLTGRLRGQERGEVEAEAMRLLERVGLGSSADKFPHQLSGGMQQRLAIAQALIVRPKVLLLDEPFGALDPHTRKSMHHLVRELWEENQMTIVMVTHDLSEAFSLSTRVIAIDKIRYDPQDPTAYGSRIVSDIEAKSKIVRESRKAEAVRMLEAVA